MLISFSKISETTHSVNLGDDIHIDQIKTGDFNNDGKIDVVISSIHRDLGTTPAPFIFLLGDEKGSFKDASTFFVGGNIQYGNYVPRMEIGDINGDGVSDIFGIDNGIDKPPFSGGRNELFLSDGKGGMFNASSFLPQLILNSHGASLGDVNNDGRIDILVNALMSDGNHLWMQDKNGHFKESPELLPPLKIDAYWDPTQQVTQTNTYSALIDINNDGFLDMILGGWSGGINQSQIFINHQGSFSSSIPTTLPSTGVNGETVVAIEPIDINGDDLPDLVLSVTDGSNSANTFYLIKKIQILINKGNGVFKDESDQRITPTTEIINKGWYKTLDVIDLNKDGAMDIVAHPDWGSPEIFMNDGSGNFNKNIFIEKNYSKSSVGDFDGDGLPDLILSNDKSSVEIWRNESINKHIYKANFGGDILVGSTGNDIFIQTTGHSKFIGNGGIDTLQLTLDKNKYSIEISDSKILVSQIDSEKNSVELLGVQRIKFSTYSIATDINGNAGNVAKILGAVFGKDAIQNKGFVGVSLSLLDNGMSTRDFASLALAVKGASTSEQIATTLWTNIVGKTPTAAENASLVDIMDSGVSAGDLTMVAADLALNHLNVDLVGLSQNGLAYLDFVT